MKTDIDLTDAGKAAVVEAIRLWNLDVGDPAPQFLVDPHQGANEKWLELHARALRWRTTIDEILQAAGWGASTPYKGNHHPNAPEWCGLFAGKCWRDAGLDPKWIAGFFASTVRLYNWAHYLPFNQHTNVRAPKQGEPRRMVAKLGTSSTVADLPFTVREGDIVVIGGPHDPSVGRHITLATGIDLIKGVVHTVSGNGGGLGPDGKWREGIVVTDVKIGGVGDHVMWVYRPAPADLL